MPVLKRILGTLRPFLILFALFFIISIAAVGFQGFRTLQRLTAVEAERDGWQRPADIIKALGVGPGSVVVDLGSGAGYFTLKLSDAVGPKGRVVAVDLRQLSLMFLSVRAFRQGNRNVDINIGTVDDPHLQPASADAVLIANTFHELSEPKAILTHVSRALRPGGRLVVVDRIGRLDSAETQLRGAGFNITSREESFIHQQGDEVWWLIAANKP
jgi:ubiquinone/menaquinone biosynthesis C-methylase UbiE